MDKQIISNDLKEEVFFLDPKEEYEYFLKRLKSIQNYSNDFFRAQATAALVKRYIRAMASLGDKYETETLKDVYQDCLMQLGMDDYCIEAEVENYKTTHQINKENILVSTTAKK